MCEPGALKRSVSSFLIATSIGVQVPALLVNYDTYYLRISHASPPRALIDHFDTKSAQLGVQFELMARSLVKLPWSVRQVRDSSRPQLYRAGMEGGAAPRLWLDATPWPIPDLWWFYFPLVGVPSWVAAVLAALCIGLIGGGVRALRRIDG